MQKAFELVQKQEDSGSSQGQLDVEQILRQTKQQLGTMRQQSLRECLESSSLAQLGNKQVLQDVLFQFFTTHDQEFLHTIALAICQVKSQCQALTRQLHRRQKQEATIRNSLEKQLNQIYGKQLEEFLDKWLRLEELCAVKLGQRNPDTAVSKASRLLEELRLECQSLSIIKDQCLQYKSSYQSEKQETVRLTLCLSESKGAVEALTVSNQALQKECREMEQKTRKAQQLNKFLETKTCEFNKKNTRLVYELQMGQKQIHKKEAQLNGLLQQRIQWNRKEALLVARETQLSEKILKDQQRIVQLEKKLQQKDKHIVSMDEQLKQLLDQRTLAAQKEKQMQKNEQQLKTHLQTLEKQLLQVQMDLKRKNEQIQDFSCKLSKRQKLMKDYLTGKDQEIKMVEEELLQLREQMTEKEEIQPYYQQYLQWVAGGRQKIGKTVSQEQIYTNKSESYKQQSYARQKTKLKFLLRQLRKRVTVLAEENKKFYHFLKKQLESLRVYTFRMVQFLSRVFLQREEQNKNIDNKQIQFSSILTNNFPDRNCKPESFDMFRKQENNNYKPFYSLELAETKLFQKHHQQDKKQLRLSSTIKKAGERMKFIREQTQNYQVHLSRVIGGK